MSYSFQIEARDGALTITQQTDPSTIPDGVFSVSGHEDADWASLGIARNQPEGTQVINANSYANYPKAS